MVKRLGCWDAGLRGETLFLLCLERLFVERS